MKECGGCQTCEIACSFRQTGEFNNLVSSIEIIELVEKPGYKVRIHQESSGRRIKCDGCIKETGEPLCVQYCRQPEKLLNIINDFRRSQNFDN